MITGIITHESKPVKTARGEFYVRRFRVKDSEEIGFEIHATSVGGVENHLCLSHEGAKQLAPLLSAMLVYSDKDPEWSLEQIARELSQAS